jgi:hypothetical protein
MLTAVEDRPISTVLESDVVEVLKTSPALPDRLYVKRRDIDPTIAEAVRLIDAGDLEGAARLKDNWFLAWDIGPHAGEPFLFLDEALESVADSAYQAGWTFEVYARYCDGVAWHTHVPKKHELEVLQAEPDALRSAWDKAKVFVHAHPASGASESDRKFLAIWLDAVENYPGFDTKRRASVLKVAIAIALLVWTLGKRVLELSQRALARSAVIGRQAAGSGLEELSRCGFLNVRGAGNRPSTICPVLPERVSQLRTIRPLTVTSTTDFPPPGRGRMASSCEIRLPVGLDEPIWVLQGLRGNGYSAYVALSDSAFEEPKTVQERMGGGDVYRHLEALEVADLALVEQYGKRKRYMRNPTPDRTLLAWDEARAIAGKRAERFDRESETFAAESMVRHELELEKVWRSSRGMGIRPVAVVDPYHDIDHVTGSIIAHGKGWQLAHGVRTETWAPPPDIVAHLLMSVSALEAHWEWEQALKRRMKVARPGGKRPPGRTGAAPAVLDALVSLLNVHLNVHWASLGGVGDPPVKAVLWDTFVDVATGEAMPALAGHRLLELYAAEGRSMSAPGAVAPATPVFVSEAASDDTVGCRS